MMAGGGRAHGRTAFEYAQREATDVALRLRKYEKVPAVALLLDEVAASFA
jgi:hypothetical protein